MLGSSPSMTPVGALGVSDNLRGDGFVDSLRERYQILAAPFVC